MTVGVPSTAPWLAPHAVRLAALASLDGAARLARLDAWARDAGIATESGRALRFVAASDAHAPAGAARIAYEARIFEAGEVATRLDGDGARHDLYNALAWLAWPRTKARLNALHARALADAAPIPSTRGPLRDAATLFDENAALWLGLDASLEGALRAFDWRRLFVEHRARVESSVRVVAFGHALLEKLDAPFKAITAHAWPLRVAADAPPDAIDAALAASLDADRLTPRAFCPLPVLGVPGWCEANRDPAFYNDAAVFRPGRRRAPVARPSGATTHGDPHPMLLGCIADDFTGASDLANTLTAGGMRTVQAIGVPSDASTLDADAVVIALKSRSIPAADAVAQSLDALRWLRARGARQILFKYCSTFDSTPEGNIGPVAQALLDALDAPLAIACPAFPTNKRTVYMGHLFVADRLLNESGLQHHPLNPMTDPDLVRWLQRQTPYRVGLLAQPTVARGAAAVRDALAALAAGGTRLAVADAIADADLRTLGEACADAALITGGSGIALGLPDNFRRAGLLRPHQAALEPVGGAAVVISGSCSTATRRQVDGYAAHAPSRRVDVDAVLDGRETAATLADWVLAQQRQVAGVAPLVYSSADPDAVRAAQAKHGAQAASAAIERCLGELSALLYARGVRRQVIAGGETSGAVVQALGVRLLAIGAEIDPGVPALAGVDAPVGLALKSGNFGADDFFDKALAAVR